MNQRLLFKNLPFITFFTIYTIIMMSLVPQSGIDWEYAFRPAALALLRFESPFTITPFYSVPWVLLPLLPFAILPEWVGRFFVQIIGLIAYAYLANHFTSRKSEVIIFMLSPMVLQNLFYANIDSLALLGLILPPVYGLFFVFVKPQIGLGIALYWLYEAILEKRAIRTFAPFACALLLTFLLFGLWPLRFNQLLSINASIGVINTSLFPWSLPLGIFFILAAWRKSDQRFAIAASPFLSPHVMFYSWAVCLLPILSSKKWFYLGWAISWLAFIIFMGVLPN